jgi:hypothetical protein
MLGCRELTLALLFGFYHHQFLGGAVLLVSHVFPVLSVVHRNADAKPRFFFGRKAIHFIFI